MPRKSRHGSLDHFAETSDLLHGPSSLKELLAWPDDILGRFVAHDQVHNQGAGWRRFLAHMSRGIVATSDFSGWDSQKEVTRLMTLAAESLANCKVHGFVWVSCGDKEESPQRHMLREIAELEGGGACVLGDINDHVHADVLALVDAVEPDTTCTSAQRAQCYAAQLDILLRSATAFPVGQVAWCYMHKRKCPANILGALHLGLDRLSASGMQGPGPPGTGPMPGPKRRRKLMPQSSAEGRTGSDAWWYHALRVVELQQQHGSGTVNSNNSVRKNFLKAVLSMEEPHDGGPEEETDILQDGHEGEDEEQEPWLASWGSTACTAWTGLGHQQCDSDSTERPHNIFVAERHHRSKAEAEDFYWHENSNNYPFAAKQGKPLEDSHVCVEIKANGIMLGYPYNRPRSLGFAFKRDKFVWVGSSNPQAEFEEIFRRSVRATGDTYFIAGPDEVESEYRQMAECRGHTLPPSFGFDDVDTLTKVLPPGHVDRYLEWGKLREANQSLAGVFLADLDHHPHTGPTSGPFYPSMPTHSTTFSYSERRLHLGLEAFVVHGLHAYKELGEKPHYMCKFAPQLSKLSRRHQETLVGNSLFAPVVCAWMAYCLGNLQQRCDATALPQVLSGPTTGLELEEEEDAD